MGKIPGSRSRNEKTLPTTRKAMMVTRRGCTTRRQVCQSEKTSRWERLIWNNMLIGCRLEDLPKVHGCIE
jgi:hypothetical protein